MLAIRLPVEVETALKHWREPSGAPVPSMPAKPIFERLDDLESLGEIPHEVFGDRVYLAYAFLKESVQPLS